MKKMFLGLGMMVAMLGVSQVSHAIGIKIFGLEIKYVRGMKVYHPDRKTNECEQKGFCEFEVKASAGKIKGNLGKDDEGKLIVIISDETMRAFPEDFNASTYPSERIFIPADLTKDLGFPNGYEIQKGEHIVRRDPATGKTYVVL